MNVIINRLIQEKERENERTNKIKFNLASMVQLGSIGAALYATTATTIIMGLAVNNNCAKKNQKIKFFMSRFFVCSCTSYHTLVQCDRSVRLYVYTQIPLFVVVSLWSIIVSHER